MAFTNPSIQSKNNDEIESKLDEINKKIDDLKISIEMINSMTSELLVSERDNAVLQSISSNEKINKIDDSNNNVTFYFEEKIPLHIEATGGMQRTINLNSNQLSILKNTINKNVNDEVVPFDLNNNQEEVISFKM